MHAARPLLASHVAVVAAQLTDPRAKTAACVRCGIEFTRSVRRDRPVKAMCNDCKAVAPRFIKGENHVPSTVNCPAAADPEAACASAPDC